VNRFLNTHKVFVIPSKAKNLIFRLLRHGVVDATPRNDSVNEGKDSTLETRMI
jgi:hypothetical protein